MTPRKPGTDRRPQAGEARSSTGKPAPGGAGRLPGTAGVPRKVSRARGRRDLPRQRGGEPWSSPQDRACGKGGRPPNAASPPSLFLMGFYVATVLSSSTPGNRGVGGCWSRSSPQSRHKDTCRAQRAPVSQRLVPGPSTWLVSHGGDSSWVGSPEVRYGELGTLEEAHGEGGERRPSSPPAAVTLPTPLQLPPSGSWSQGGL